MKFLYFALVVLAVVGCALSAGSGYRPAGCMLPIKAGPCMAYFPSYGYNATTNKCEKFIYGGCQGNGNRFSYIEECEIICKAGQ